MRAQVHAERSPTACNIWEILSLPAFVAQASEQVYTAVETFNDAASLLLSATGDGFVGICVPVIDIKIYASLTH